MKSKLKIIIPIAIAVTAIILALIFIQFKPEKTQVEANSLDIAQSYLVEQSYEQAIAEFKKIIEIDPMNVDAYIGIAEAYEAMGDVDSAVEWLEKGYEFTGDGRILDYLNRLKAIVETADVTEETTIASETTTTVTKTEATVVEEFITIKGMKYSTSLTELDLSNWDLTDEDIKDLNKMTNLTYLNLENNKISDISPISNLTNLNSLLLARNQINNIIPLTNLTNLTDLWLSRNQISDISPLSNLTNLTEFLVLDDNQISDISPLSNLTDLMGLSLKNNQISDISPLSYMTALTELYLGGNQISAEDIEWLEKQLPYCYLE